LEAVFICIAFHQCKAATPKVRAEGYMMRKATFGKASAPPMVGVIAGLTSQAVMEELCRAFRLEHIVLKRLFLV